MECTGIFTSKEKASVHLGAGAKRVLVSTASDGADATIVYGVNHQILNKDHIVVSNASCTTNCLAPVVDVVNKTFGIDHGMMTTIHSYTGDQPTLDTLHKDLYRARAAALSQIPTSTGAAKAIGLVIPELKGKLDGISIRVPTPNVSLVDVKFILKKIGDQGRGQCRLHRGRQGPPEGHPQRHQRAQRVVGLQPRPGVLDRRAAADQGHGRHHADRALLVRQRVGLLQPHVRHRRRHVEVPLGEQNP